MDANTNMTYTRISLTTLVYKGVQLLQLSSTHAIVLECMRQSRGTNITENSSNYGLCQLRIGNAAYTDSVCAQKKTLGVFLN